MPYIPDTDRPKYEKQIRELVETLTDGYKQTAKVGEVNFVISSIIWELFLANSSYTNGNNLIGVLECVKQEFYRRQLAPYEDLKIKENGDII